MTNRKNRKIEVNYSLDDILGYCLSCKTPILTVDDYVKDKGKFYCIDCYKKEHDIVEELEF